MHNILKRAQSKDKKDGELIAYCMFTSQQLFWNLIESFSFGRMSREEIGKWDWSDSHSCRRWVVTQRAGRYEWISCWHPAERLGSTTGQSWRLCSVSSCLLGSPLQRTTLNRKIKWRSSDAYCTIIYFRSNITSNLKYKQKLTNKVYFSCIRFCVETDAWCRKIFIQLNTLFCGIAKEKLSQFNKQILYLLAKGSTLIRSLARRLSSTSCRLQHCMPMFGKLKKNSTCMNPVPGDHSHAR